MSKQNNNQKDQMEGLEDLAQMKTKTMLNLCKKLEGPATIGKMCYATALKSFEQKGKEIFSQKFHAKIDDRLLLYQLFSYFLKDEPIAVQFGLDLNKGILLTGPIGSGKTSIMTLMRFFEQPSFRYILKSCRDISFEFIKDGYEIIHRYSRNNFLHDPKPYCFDDLGVENNLKYFGNECNVMAEVILSRYDQFISRKAVTHLTTNLSATEIEEIYGNRVRSRMREMFNLIAFDRSTPDKRK